MASSSGGGARALRPQQQQPPHPASSSSTPIHLEGYLHKKGARVHMWSGRYAVLRGNRLLLVRGKKEDMDSSTHPPAKRYGTSRIE